MMIKIKYLISILFLLLACSKSKDSTASLEGKQKELKEAHKQFQQIKSTIAGLEKEIQALDSSAIKRNVIIVAASVVKKEPFEHKIEMRGSVQSRKNIKISAQVSGAAEKVYVREGQPIRKGQLLLSIDADVLKNQIEEYRTSLKLATVMYEKRLKLWSQQVGTEIQYLQAKNEKESLERRLATVQSQLKQTRITAPFEGTVEKMIIKEGELVTPGAVLLQIISPKHMYLQADVSERHIGRLYTGEKVAVFFPFQKKNVTSTIQAVGQVVNEQNRTFEIEIKMPKVGFKVSPNQVVILRLRDYYNEQAWVVPTRIIQQDSKGQFIFCVNSQKGNLIAQKKAITIGESYEGKTEVLSGLSGGEQIVYKGFRELADGNEVSVVTDEATGQ